MILGDGYFGCDALLFELGYLDVEYFGITEMARLHLRKLEPGWGLVRPAMPSS